MHNHLICVLQAPPPITPRSPFQVCVLSYRFVFLELLVCSLGDWGKDEGCAKVGVITSIEV